MACASTASRPVFSILVASSAGSASTRRIRGCRVVRRRSTSSVRWPWIASASRTSSATRSPFWPARSPPSSPAQRSPLTAARARRSSNGTPRHRDAGRRSSPQQKARQAAQGAVAVVGDDEGIADRHSELRVLAQGDWDVKGHSGLERNLHVPVEAQNVALAPVRREGHPNGVAAALAVAVREASLVNDRLDSVVNVRAALPRPELLQAGDERLLADRVHLSREIGNITQENR